jgi:hypothetical protein
MPSQGSGFAEDVGIAIDPGVVGDNALHRRVVGGEELRGAQEERRAGVGAFIGMDLGVGNTAVVVHRRMQIVVADPDVVETWLASSGSPPRATIR